MSKLKIFVSSTCYDLNIVRSQLRGFILGMGYEPIMSDYNDVLYDPRIHTHESCLKEVQSCDMVILIIGARFGGEAIPCIAEKIDWEKLKSLSTKHQLFDEGQKYSITQMEVLKAIELGIPIYVFVDEEVNHEHLFYEKNKSDEDFIKKIKFPSIEKNETAVYIFEFINYLRSRISNNSLVTFKRMEDIESYLRVQWASLFQRLLSEQSSSKNEQGIIESISDQIDGLKTILVSSMSDDSLRETAKGVLKYRRVVTFFKELSVGNISLLQKSISWEEVLKECNIEEIICSNDERRFRRVYFYIKKDKTFFKSRVPYEPEVLENEWNQFIRLDPKKRKAIIEAVDDDSSFMPRYLLYRGEELDEDIKPMSVVTLNK